MSKRKILAIAIIAIIGAMTVGCTSAYFATSSQAHNIITTSGVAIELIEDTEEEGNDGRPVPFTNIEGAMAGDRISKIPKIRNIDDSEVFVRMKLIANVELANGSINKISPNAFDLDISRSWSPKNGYYYYLYPLAKGETTRALFTTVVIPQTSTSNKYQGAKYTLTIKAEAVQTAHNGTDPLEAQGWPGE